jgi:hypothetical protein
MTETVTALQLDWNLKVDQQATNPAPAGCRSRWQAAAPTNTKSLQALPNGPGAAGPPGGGQSSAARCMRKVHGCPVGISPGAYCPRAAGQAPTGAHPNAGLGRALTALHALVAIGPEKRPPAGPRPVCAARAVSGAARRRSSDEGPCHRGGRGMGPRHRQLWTRSHSGWQPITITQAETCQWLCHWHCVAGMPVERAAGVAGTHIAGALARGLILRPIGATFQLEAMAGSAGSGLINTPPSDVRRLRDSSELDHLRGAAPARWPPRGRVRNAGDV